MSLKPRGLSLGGGTYNEYITAGCPPLQQHKSYKTLLVLFERYQKQGAFSYIFTSILDWCFTNSDCLWNLPHIFPINIVSLVNKLEENYGKDTTVQSWIISFFFVWFWGWWLIGLVMHYHIFLLSLILRRMIHIGPNMHYFIFIFCLIFCRWLINPVMHYFIFLFCLILRRMLN